MEDMTRRSEDTSPEVKKEKKNRLKKIKARTHSDKFPGSKVNQTQTTGTYEQQGSGTRDAGTSTLGGRRQSFEDLPVYCNHRRTQSDAIGNQPGIPQSAGARGHPDAGQKWCYLYWSDMEGVK